MGRSADILPFFNELFQVPPEWVANPLDKTRYAAAFNEHTTDQVAGAFWCDHVNIDVFWGGNRTEMDIKTMPEREVRARFQIR